jgi:hypothetical protein
MPAIEYPDTEIFHWEQAARSWPWVRDQWPNLPSDCRSLAVAPKKRLSLEPLLNLSELEALHITPIRAQEVAVLSKLKKLKVLLLYDIRVESLSELSGLRNLEVLRIMHAAKLRTFAGLEHFQKLRVLDIYHLPNVADLKPLSGLSNLRELSIRMSFGTNKLLQFDTLEPLGRLGNLEILELSGVNARDSSLHPLVRLQKLRYLLLGLFYPIEEYAYLTANLPSGISECLQPVLTPGENGKYLICKKCKGRQVELFGKTSSRSRFLVCPKCDKKIIEEHVRLFEEYLQKYQTTKTKGNFHGRRR